MKTKLITGLFVMFILGVSNSYTQTAFTLTTNKTNIYNTTATIDNPQLNNNPDAVVAVTPVNDNAGNQYKDAVAAWFMPADKRWHVFNINQARMQADKIFEIKFWTKSDANHFVHLVTQENLKNGTSRIDNPALDNHPRASFNALQTMVSARGDAMPIDNAPYPKYNEAEKKWYIESTNGGKITVGSAYNILINSTGTPAKTQPDLNSTNIKNPNSQNTSPNNSSSSPTGSTGGEIAGIQTFFKVEDQNNSPKFSDSSSEPQMFPTLSQTIVLNRKSSLVVNVLVNLSHVLCNTCKDSEGSFYVQINNITTRCAAWISIGHGTDSTNTSISGCIIKDLSPGTHKISFSMDHRPNTPGFDTHGVYSSIIVIPVE